MIDGIRTGMMWFTPMDFNEMHPNLFPVVDVLGLTYCTLQMLRLRREA